MMWHRMILALLLLTGGFGAAAAHTLTGEYVIVLAADATEAENTAAMELQHYLHRISGTWHRIVEQAEGRPALYVGWSPEVSGKLDGVTPEGMAADRIIIRSSGADLILTGARPRGALYAVDTFLEEVLGVRWWTPEAEAVPEMSPVVFLEQEVDYTPFFEYREAYVRLLGDHPQWRVRLKQNGMFNWSPPTGAELGSAFHYVGGYDGFGHTMYAVLPPAVYFDIHPEWYGWFDGKRQHTYPNDQLCLTNAEMKQEFIRQLLRRIAENPGDIVSVTQMDSKRGCQCESCLASDARYGAPSGTLLAFVNDVAMAVEEAFPGMPVETFAYLHTQKPPHSIVPRANVQIRLCSYHGDFARPLDEAFSAENRQFFADLQQWAAIAPRLSIWNYSANFNNFLMPHPNITSYGPNMKLFADHRVKGVFDQGDSYTHVSELQALRAWLAAKLLWRPDADAAALIDEFLNGYYKNTAPYFKEYIQVMHDTLLQNQELLPCGSPGNRNAEWLNYTTAMQADRLMREASASISGDPELMRRVLWARIPLDWAILAHYDTYRQIAALRGEAFDFPTRLELLRHLGAMTRLTGTNNAGESEYLKSFEEELRLVENRREAGIPAENGGRPWLDLQESAFRLYAAPGIRVTEDAAASNGLSLEIDPISQWSGSVTLPPELGAFGLWRVYAVVRAEAAANSEERSLWCGIYDAPAKLERVARFIPGKVLADGKFRSIDLGVHAVHAGMSVFIGNVADTGKLYCDRVFLVYEPEAPHAGIPLPPGALVVEDGAFQLRETASPLGDPEAADGSCVRMFSQNEGEAMRSATAQWPGWSPGRYELYFDLHCDSALPVELTVEVVDAKSGGTIASTMVKPRCNVDGFQRIFVGELRLEDCEVRLKGSGNPAFQRILVDRMILVRKGN